MVEKYRVYISNGKNIGWDNISISQTHISLTLFYRAAILALRTISNQKEIELF